MILKLVLQKTGNDFIFINTELETSIPIPPDVVQYEQMVYDFVSENNLTLLGAYYNEDGIYEVTVDVWFKYRWDAVNKTVSLHDIKTNVVYLNRLESYEM